MWRAGAGIRRQRRTQRGRFRCDRTGRRRMRGLRQPVWASGNLRRPPPATSAALHWRPPARSMRLRSDPHRCANARHVECHAFWVHFAAALEFAQVCSSLSRSTISCMMSASCSCNQICTGVLKPIMFHIFLRVEGMPITRYDTLKLALVHSRH